MIPPDGAKRKLDGLVDSAPPDKDCEVFDKELANKQRDETELKFCSY